MNKKIKNKHSKGVKKVKKNKKTKRPIKQTQRSKRIKKYKTIKKKMKIKDIPFANSLNKGTFASSNFIEYHYQNYSNIIDFLSKEVSNKNITNVCFFKKPKESFLQVNINKKSNTTKPIYTSFNLFKKNVEKCLKNKRYTPIVVDIIQKENNHANIILIDSDSKRVELFEPHGYKSSRSGWDEISGAYEMKKSVINKFFKKLLPDFEFINVVDIIKPSFQSMYDKGTGYCVTWSILYCHYRIINPHISLKNLTKYLDYRINTTYLLRYAKYIENVLKGK